MAKKNEQKRPELTVGSLVTIDDHRNSTGGIIYRIAMRGEPVKPAFTQIDVDVKVWNPKPGKMWDPRTPENGEYVTKKQKKYGYFNERKKKMANYVVHGYVRLRPEYEFYPTSTGQRPSGKGGTILVEMNCYQFDQIKPVTLTDLGVRFQSLANLIRDFVAMKSAPVNITEDAEVDESGDDED